MQALRSRLWINLWNNSSHNTGNCCLFFVPSTTSKRACPPGAWKRTSVRYAATPCWPGWGSRGWWRTRSGWENRNLFINTFRNMFVIFVFMFIGSIFYASNSHMYNIVSVFMKFREENNIFIYYLYYYLYIYVCKCDSVFMKFREENNGRKHFPLE